MSIPKKNPKVSVLFPVYNTPIEYLREAMDSILGQTFQDFEFIIINDASTNAAIEEIIAGYSDLRIRYYKNHQHMGISGTRNKLLDLAKGEYLAVMDHDDISLPERFEKEVRYLDTNSNVGVVSCSAGIINSRKVKVLAFPSNDEDIRLSLFEGCSIIHSASMIRKSVLDTNNIRYEEEFSPAEDYALFCRLIPCTCFHNLPDILFRYRYHESNTSLLQKAKMEISSLAVKCFFKTENPVLYQIYLERATHVTNVKILGVIPCIRIERCGRRSTCTIFGVPLYRSKRKSEIATS